MSTSAGETPRPLPPRDAYRLWAPHYQAETAVSALERQAVDRVTPPAAGRTLLDAGCGTGRRLYAAGGAKLAVGVDLVPDMIRAGSAHSDAASRMQTAAADVRALPLRGGVFDIVWCRLVLGHLADPAPAYDELGRVAAAGATLIVTDFHPAATAAGHSRSFRDETGRLHEIEHHMHAEQLHVDAARHAGWHVRERVDLRVGPCIRTFYEEADVMDRYDAQLGMPLVLMLVFCR